MLESIAELTHARPHLRSSARFDLEQLRIYHEGYYAGVIYALRVADLAAQRFVHVTNARRAETRRKRSA